MKKSGLIVVNKPQGMTSHTVVSRMRRILNMKRVGHTGTLDPMATGVLPVLFGVATKLSDMLIGDDKAYRASFQLGLQTDTQDITGTVISRLPLSISFEEVSAAVSAFKGRQQQVPPMYSAVKVKGRKLYELAREGRTAARAPRTIMVYRCELISMTPDGLCEAEFEVSKGTYIRTLVDDIGKRLGCGATLTSLCRTKSGQFDLSMAFDLDELERLAREGDLDRAVIDMNGILKHLPCANLSAEQVRKIKNGVRIPADEVIGRDGLPVILDSCCSFNVGEPVRLFNEAGELFALGSFSVLRQGAVLCLKTSLWEAD